MQLRNHWAQPFVTSQANLVAILEQIKKGIKENEKKLVPGDII